MTDDVDRFMARLLGRLLERHQASQVFLFGSDGEPFWAARSHLEERDLQLLEAAVELIGDLERTRAKPFVGHDPARRFCVAGLDGQPELYVALLDPGPDFEVAEQRVARIRDEVVVEIAPFRNRLAV